jgi:hypothetical protein
MPEWITVLGYIFGGVGVAASFVGYFGKRRGDEIIKYQAKDNAALKAYNATLEGDNSRLVAERDNWKQQADTFRSNSQGSPELIKLTVAVTNQTEQMTKLTQVVTEQTQVIAKMGGLDGTTTR